MRGAAIGWMVPQRSARTGHRYSTEASCPSVEGELVREFEVIQFRGRGGVDGDFSVRGNVEDRSQKGAVGPAAEAACDCPERVRGDGVPSWAGTPPRSRRHPCRSRSVRREEKEDITWKCSTSRSGTSSKRASGKRGAEVRNVCRSAP